MVNSSIDTAAYLAAGPDKQHFFQSLKSKLCRCATFPDEYRTATPYGCKCVATTDLSIVQDKYFADNFLTKGTKYRHSQAPPQEANAYAALYKDQFKQAFAKLIKERAYDVDPNVSKEEVGEWGAAVREEVEKMRKMVDDYEALHPATKLDTQAADCEF